jgi:hypothetical protein
MGGKKLHSYEELQQAMYEWLGAENHKNFFPEESINFINVGGPLLNGVETV